MTVVRNPFSKVSRKLPNKYNWETGQAGAPQSLESYIKTAEQLVPSLDAYMQFLSDKLGIKLEIIPACVKSESSARRKFMDSSVSSNPEKIKDYLRATIIIPNTEPNSIKNLKRIINFLKSSPDTVGFKDQFSEPEPNTGFRSFKLHTRIVDPENPDIQMSAEIIIQHAGMLEANKHTAMLRSMERRLREADSGLKSLYSRAATRLTISREGLRSARKDIHDLAAQRTGLNELLDPKVRQDHECNIEDTLERLTGGNKGVKGRVATLIAGLTRA